MVENPDGIRSRLRTASEVKQSRRLRTSAQIELGVVCPPAANSGRFSVCKPTEINRRSATNQIIRTDRAPPNCSDLPLEGEDEEEVSCAELSLRRSVQRRIIGRKIKRQSELAALKRAGIYEISETVAHKCVGASGLLSKEYSPVTEVWGLHCFFCEGMSTAYARESSDSPILNAFWRVAPSVRLSVFAILPAGVLFFANAFNSRTFAALQLTLLRDFGIYKSPMIKKRGVIALSHPKGKRACAEVKWYLISQHVR